MSDEQARQAIVGPAQLFGIPFEEALVERLLGDLHDEGIDPPELQIVLDRLYQARSGQRIGLEDYVGLGGTQQILVAYLHTTLQQGLPLPSGSQTLVLRRRDLPRQVLKAMVTERGTKAVVSLEEVGAQVSASRAEVSTVLHGLVATRLVRSFADDEGRDVYELAHEYLILEVLSWASEQELLLRHARTVLRSELESWKRMGSLMSADRLALLGRERTRLELEPEERALMLRAAAVHGESLARWMLPESKPALFELLADRTLSADSRRRVLLQLASNTWDERLLEAMEEIGNPSMLGQLSSEFRRRMQLRYARNLVHVPAGRFWRGSTRAQKAERKALLPRHLHARVESEPDLFEGELDEFWIGRCLVTNEEFAEFRAGHRRW